MPTMKDVGRLQAAVETAKQEQVAAAIRTGAASCSEVAKFLGIDRSQAWRLLRRFGYTKEQKWNSRKGRPKA